LVELAFGPISTASNSTPSYRCRLVALASVLNFEIWQLPAGTRAPLEKGRTAR